MPGISLSNSLTGTQIDLGFSALAAASFFVPFSESGNFIIQGIRGFALANLADRSLRWLLLDKSKHQQSHGRLLQGICYAVIEEALYSGILATQKMAWLIPRFLTSWALGSTAARTFESVGEKQNIGISRDHKRGFLWGLFREAALMGAPIQYSTPLLLASDSVVFGLIEVCPNNESHPLPRYSREWIYKSVSGVAFRAIGNIVALHAGLASAVVQHVLFNISRAYPEKFPSRISS